MMQHRHREGGFSWEYRACFSTKRGSRAMSVIAPGSILHDQGRNGNTMIKSYLDLRAA